MEQAIFDTSALDALFDDAFDNEHSVASGKERIRAYSTRYYEWIGSAKRKVAKVQTQAVDVIKKLVMDSSDGECCPKCNGAKFAFVRIKVDGKPKIVKVDCGRCMGKGFVTAVDKERFQAYLNRKQRDISYLSYCQ